MFFLALNVLRNLVALLCFEFLLRSPFKEQFMGRDKTALVLATQVSNHNKCAAMPWEGASRKPHYSVLKPI